MQHWTCSNARETSKHYHPLLENENELYTKVHNILPKSLARLFPKGTRLAHLYGLAKIPKPELSVRPILSASGTYIQPSTCKMARREIKASVNQCLRHQRYLLILWRYQNPCWNWPRIGIIWRNRSVCQRSYLRNHHNIGLEGFQRKLVHDTYNLKFTKDQLADLLRFATTNHLFST